MLLKNAELIKKNRVRTGPVCLKKIAFRLFEYIFDRFHRNNHFGAFLSRT